MNCLFYSLYYLSEYYWKILSHKIFRKVILQRE